MFTVVTGGSGSGKSAFAENLIGAGGMGQTVVNHRTFMAQSLNGLHGGQGLELRPVVMGKMKSYESGAHSLPSKSKQIVSNQYRPAM